MKYFIAMILLTCLAYVGASEAQSIPNPMLGLTETQALELQLKAAKMRQEATGTMTTANGVVQTLSAFEGIGKETGVAVREALNGVVDVADKFGNTNVGQITIAMVIWRIVGEDIIELLVAIPVFIFGATLSRWFLRKHRTEVEFEYKTVLWGAFQRQRIKSEKHDLPDAEAKVVALLVAFVTVAASMMIIA